MLKIKEILFLPVGSLFISLQAMKYRKLKISELDRLSPESYQTAEKTPVILILDNIRSLNNIGSVFRTADAFRIQKIYLCGITARPPHRDIQKTALGATESVPWEYIKNTLDIVEKLRQQKVEVISVEQTEKSIFLNNFTINPKKTYALIFGNEVKGVSQEVVSASDSVIEIPQFGTKHSLNIAVSTGIVCWDFFSQFLAAGLFE